MKNRLFSIFTALFIALPFLSCSLPPGSLEDPLHDPQQAPQQEHLPEGAKGRIKKDKINDIAYSPDGTKLAVAGGNGIWLYDAQTGHELVQFAGHTDTVTVHNVAFRPDGKTIVSAGTSYDQTIRIWDVNTGRNLRTFKYQVFDVAFSPDGKMIVSGSPDKNLYLLDADTGKLVRTLSGHTDFVWSVAFSPDGKTIASRSQDKTIRLWDANTGKLLRTLTMDTHLPKYFLNIVIFSPDGKVIASVGNDRTICLWDANTGKRLRTIARNTTPFHKNLAFSPDGSMIACNNWLDIDLWDVNNGKLLRTLTGYRENNPSRREWRRGHIGLIGPPGIFTVVFSPDGKTIAGASVHGVHLWDVNTGYLRKLISGF